jgi:hypothetical protein
MFCIGKIECQFLSFPINSIDNEFGEHLVEQNESVSVRVCKLCVFKSCGKHLKKQDELDDYS